MLVHSAEGWVMLTDKQRSTILPLWIAIVSFGAIWFLNENFWNAAIIAIFVGVSGWLDFGQRWLLRGTFGLAILAIAVSLIAPHIDQWMQWAQEARQTLVSLTGARP
jgi:hypothetical protein